MTVMTDTLVLPGGAVASKVPVKILKLAPTEYDAAFEDGDEVAVVGSQLVQTDTTGLLSVDLIPTADLIPVGTVYQAVFKLRGRVIYAPIFTVPATGPAWIGAHLTDPPGALTSSALGAETAARIAADALKLDKAANLSDLANATTSRTNLGLGNVNNTSDASKPVSTAQQTALNAKTSLLDSRLNAGKEHGRALVRRRRHVPAPSKPFPTIADAASKYIYWLSPDGTTLFGGQGANLLRSTNDWQTTEVLKSFGALPVQAVRTLDNGELLVAVSDATTVPGELWVSTGYPTLGAAAAWTRTLVAESGGLVYFAPMWGLSAHGARVVAAEYGTQTPPNNARKVYLSENSGLTWRVIYDMGQVAGAHTHGCAYDRFRDWIWIATGDGANRSLRYARLDENFATWRSLWVGDKNDQPTFLFPMAHCLLYGTDNSPNGIGRVWIDWVSNEPSFEIEYAYIVEDNRALTILPGMPFQRDPASPLFIPWTRVANGPGYLVGTKDGIDFFELWKDTISYGNVQGPNFAVGPTASGKLFITNNDGRFASRSIISMRAPTFGPKSTKWGRLIRTTYALGPGNVAPALTASNIPGSTGDLDVRAKVRRANWTPTAQEDLASHYTGSDGNRGWVFAWRTDAKPQLRWFPNGTNATLTTAVATAVPPLLANKAYTLRAELRLNNGSGVYQVDFYYSSDDGATWTVLGSPVVGAAVTNLFNAPQPIVAGGEASGNLIPWTGQFYRLEVRTGAAGAMIAGVNFEDGQFQVGDELPADYISGPQPQYIDDVGNEWKLTALTRIRAVETVETSPSVEQELIADSGWNALVLATDITVGASWTHKGVRKIGKEVIINLNIAIANPAIDKLLFTLDAAFRPTGLSGRRLNLFPGAGTALRIAENGEVRAETLVATTSIGEVRYLID